MAKWVLAAFLGAAAAIAVASDDNRLERIEEDLSLLTKLLKTSVTSGPVAIPKVQLDTSVDEAANEQPRPAPFEVDAFNRYLTITPVPGDYGHQFEKLPEPIPTQDKYEAAEDADVKRFQQITSGPCGTKSLMPEANEQTVGQNHGCVAGSHQIGRSRAPLEALCPGSPIECTGNGICAGGACQCDALHYGVACDLNRCFPGCIHGSCNNGTCECDFGYAGGACENVDCVPPCSKHGHCNPKGSCECDPGFGGPICTNIICLGDSPCSGHGLCEETGGCKCDVGFGGPKCENVDLPCPGECANQGICRNGTCECAPGYTGPTCGEKASRKYICEGGAVWNEYASEHLRTCDNLHLPVEVSTSFSAKCACPPTRPIFDIKTRQCVTEDFCDGSPCGPMPVPEENEAIITVRSNAVCLDGTLDGSCPGCVQAHLPIEVCYRIGSGLAQTIGTSKEAVLGLFRKGGDCTEGVPTLESLAAVPLANMSIHHSIDTTSNLDGTRVETVENTTTISAGPSFVGLPHVSLPLTATTGSVSIPVTCTGVFEARIMIVAPDNTIASIGECSVAAQDASCPGTPECSDNGECVRGFSASKCQCLENFHGSDCSLSFVLLPTGVATVLPEGITTTLPLPENPTIEVVDGVVIVSNETVTFRFVDSETVTITDKTTGEVQVVTPNPLPPSAQKCPSNMIFGKCSKGCRPTCRNPSPRCFTTCTSSDCQCPSSLPVWDENVGRCVELAKCSQQSTCKGFGAVCGGKGECKDGTCECFSGWSGPDCQIYETRGPRVTFSNGTVTEPTLCQFPFKFKDKLYYDCTVDYDSDGLEWCSVTYEWEQRWGYCVPRGSCPSANGAECSGRGKCVDSVCVCEPNFLGLDCATQRTRYTNVTFEPCHFPFVGTDGTEHYDCLPGVPVIEDVNWAGIAETEDVSFCLKTPKYTGIDSIGYCTPAGTCGKCSDVGGQCTKSGACICKPGFTGIDCRHVMTETEILLKLFSSTNGHAWTRKGRWATQTDPCGNPKWSGISCQDGHITRINLHDNGLVGTIPEELSALPQLQVLDLSNNYLSGFFPAALGKSPKTLRSLILSQNYLTGPEPSLGAHLSVIDLSGNFFDAPQRQIQRVTDGVGTVPAFTQCKFPFEYLGRNYTACTMDWADKAWCSTTSFYSDKWGQCAELGTCIGTGGKECSGRGSCVRNPDGTGNVMCECKVGWTGSKCDVPLRRVTVTAATGKPVEDYHGRECKLPFTYMGKEYFDCTRDGIASGQEWCLLTGLWERKWGFCAPKGTCPGQVKPCSGHGQCNSATGTCKCEDGWGLNDCSTHIPRVTAGVHLAPGVPCVFPFTVEGVEYHGCTNAPSFDGVPYCATKPGEIDSDNFDECAPEGTCPGNPPCSSSGTCENGVCVCNFGFSGPDCSGQMTEVDALKKLFKATNGPKWLHKTNWNSNEDPCVWYGVKCDDKNLITGLDLSSNKLDGTIPADIGFICTMKRIDLSHNFLAGTIPSTLANVEVLDVSGNELVGKIPEISGQLLCNDNCINSNRCSLSPRCKGTVNSS